ncbi:hypothetical protein RB595_000733 [Gaeumannomyces hyphopodioides]
MTSPADSTPAPHAEAARDADATPTETPSRATQSPQTTTEPAASAPSDPVASHEPGGYTAEDDAKEEGEAGDDDATDTNGKPTTVSTTSQPADTQPPLPAEPGPEQSQSQDDGWDFTWHAEALRYYFFNRLTGESTWENPRVAASSSTTATADAAAGSQPPAPPPLPTAAGGYNPAIHGDYDTWYAQNGPKQDKVDDETPVVVGLADPGQLLSGVAFNRATGRPQRPDQGADWHGDEGRARRQMNSFFDVDAAANAHDGRSLKAERAGKRLSKGELKHFKEKRKAKREEKKRAWLRD